MTKIKVRIYYETLYLYVPFVPQVVSEILRPIHHLVLKNSNWPFSHQRRIIHLQNTSKLTDEQMDKVRRIVHHKLKSFHFQSKSYYLSDANYPKANPSQTDEMNEDLLNLGFDEVC